MRQQNFKTICTCHKKAQANDKLLKCYNEKCSHRKFFHLSCFPSNARTTWLCYECRTVTVKSRPSTPAPGDTDLEAESAGTLKSAPSTPNNIDAPSQDDSDLKPKSTATPINSSPNTINTPQDTNLEEGSSSDSDVVFVKETVNTNVNKTGSLGTLTDGKFALIEDPQGWLDCCIIHQAQIYLKQ